MAFSQHNSLQKMEIVGEEQCETDCKKEASLKGGGKRVRSPPQPKVSSCLSDNSYSELTSMTMDMPILASAFVGTFSVSPPSPTKNS